MRFVGNGYRAHDPKWSFLPVSGAGAAIKGGRFNPPGVPALYLALDLLTALRECNQGLRAKVDPCLLCTYEIDCEDIADLTSEAGRAAEGVKYEDLSAPWLRDFLDGKKPPQWAIYEALHGRGAAGVLAPSFAPGCSPKDANLVLWRWGANLPHKIVVFDPNGKLPRNPRSWEP